VAEQSTLGQFVLKNTLDVPDDTVLFDPINDNPISFFKNVLAARATPNTFRTRKMFYGRFITHLYADGSAGKSGNGMWDDVIAAYKRAGAESTQEMKLFVAIVHIPELQSYQFPEKEDWDTIHKVASNGGVFKSYVYSGQIPKYGDNVLVSFADPETRSEGVFEYPLVGGAPVVSKRRRRNRRRMGNCRENPRSNARRPNSNSSANTDSTTPPATPPAATPPGAPAAAPAPSPQAVQNQTPGVTQPRAALKRCDSRGKRIFWARTGEGASKIPQVGPNRIFGLDWSGWNPPRRSAAWAADFKKDEGVDFVIIKLTQGTGNSNRHASAHISACKNAGIKIGAYHFCASEKPGSAKAMALAEFRVFKREIERHGKNKWDIVPSLDFESGRSPKSTGHPFAAASQHNVSFYLEFCRLLKNEYGKKPLIYTAAFARAAWMNGIKNSDDWKQLGQVSSLWWAEYTFSPEKTEPLGGRRHKTWEPWSSYDIWQFSGYGRFESKGGQGRFDFNSMKKSSLSKLSL